MALSMEQVLSTCSLLSNILIFIPHRELLLSTALVSCGWKLLSYAAVQEVRYYLMSLERVLSLIRENTYPNIRKLTLGWCAGRQEILPCSNGDNVYVILLLEWLLQDVANLPHLVELGVECIADKPDLAVCTVLLVNVRKNVYSTFRNKHACINAIYLANCWR
jgi:hypothetical protein